MASPDNYSVGSGQTIDGGRAAPTGGAGGGASDIMTARPAPGLLKSVHLNDLTSVNACPGNACWYSQSTGQNGPWTNWCGAVFASNYSLHGAMVFWGGGHGGYDGTEFYVFDLTTQLWSRHGEVIATDFLSSVDATWCDYLQNGSRVVPATHTYNHPIYLPPSLGGGVKGSVCLPYNVYSERGIIGKVQPHAFDLATGISTRLTTNTLDPSLSAGPYGGCIVDKRGIMWGMVGVGSNQNVKIDLTQTTKTCVLDTSFYSAGYYANPCYSASMDMVIAPYCDYASTLMKFGAFDLSSHTPVPVTITTNISMSDKGASFGIDWCPDTGKFYIYAGLGSSEVIRLTPPSGDWRTGTWTLDTETMGGETPANVLEVVPTAQGGQPFTKWKYHPEIKCFMWSQGTVSRASPDGTSRNGAFQLYRPLGT